MDEIIRQAMTILRGVWRHRWMGVIAAWAVAVIGVVVVSRIPDKYEASARIFVDTQTILKPLMSGLAIEPNVDQQVMILSRTLISRPNIEKLIRMADLDLNLKSKAAQDALADDLMKALSIKSTARDNLYTLAYSDQEPERAKRVVQSLASIFVESSLGDKRKDTDSAKKFIEDQIQAYQKKLEDAENRLKEFRLRNLSMQAPEGKDYIGRMGEVTNELERARLDLREAENGRDALKRQIVNETAALQSDSLDASSALAVPEIDSRLDALKRNLDSLLQKYTDLHPDVVGARRMIKELEVQKKAEIEARKKLAVSNPASVASVSPQLKLAMAESEARVASLRARVGEFQNRHNQLKDSVKLVPQIEAELAQLNRDYEVNKKNYETLVSRRESAAMSGEMDASSAGVDFRLIDPPRVSPKPVSPNRLLLFPLTLVLALAAGLFVPFVASQIRPVVFDSKTLREVAQLPLLGVVSKRETEADVAMAKKGLRKFMAVSGALLGAYVVGIALLVYLSFRVV